VKTPQENGTAAGDGTPMGEPTIVSGPGFGLTGTV
jgi:hypothetical protein